jgi:PAS domain S-box-containing protein
MTAPAGSTPGARARSSSADGIENGAPDAAWLLPVFADEDQPKALQGASLNDDAYELLAEAIPHVVFIAEGDGTITYQNQRYYDYAGGTQDPDELERLVIHPDDFDRCQRLWNEAIRTGSLYQIEYRLRRIDGAYRWHLGRALPIRNAAGDIMKWFGTCTDIHDQKSAEQEVRRLNEELEQRVMDRTAALERANRVLEMEIKERERLEERDHANLERLRATVQILPIGAIVTDEKEKILNVNERFCQMFDIQETAEALSGMQLADMLAVAKRQTQQPEFYIERLRKTIEKRQEKLGEEIEMCSGRILLRDYLPIFAQGRARGHLFLYRDVTQERRIDAAKSEFMSLASHQLRTPLTSVRWAIGRLAKQLLPRVTDTEAKLFATAKSAIAHMADSIDTMLQISRIEAGKISPRWSDVDVAALLKRLTEQHRDTAAKAGIALSVRSPDSLVSYTDAGMLEEILVNLLSNAIKYTPHGGSVELIGDAGDREMKITVSDTGYGIPSHQQKKIFTKFFRAENILRMHTDGTGLGLYLSSRLADIIGASLTFESRENEGTTFRLAVPGSASAA